jgi:hypothetical protein
MRGLLSGSKNLVENLNIVKWIGDMERNQQLADHLEYLNEELSEEAQRKDLCREAHAACTKEIRNHLLTFLQNNQQQQRQEEGDEEEEEPNDTVYYETWISELHPDNLRSPPPLGKNHPSVLSNDDHPNHEDGKQNNGPTTSKNNNGTAHLVIIDPRFYSKESDHRLIWNQQMETLAAATQNDDNPHYQMTVLNRMVEPLDLTM